MNISSVLKEFRESGIRVTDFRRSVIGSFLRAKKPLSVQDFLVALRKKKKSFHKTSFYREIDFLLSKGFIRELRFQDRKKYYEWNNGHHHHVICRSCSAMQDIDLKSLEKAFVSFEKKLSSMTRFKNIQHSLEFFGICSACNSLSL